MRKVNLQIVKDSGSRIQDSEYYYTGYRNLKRIIICGLVFFIILFHSYGSGKKEQGDDEELYNQVESSEDTMEENVSEIPEHTGLEEWVEICSLGIEVGIHVHLQDKVTAEGVWEYIHGIGWDSVPDRKGFMMHFYLAGGQPLMSYLLIPYQNLFKKDDPLSNEIIPVDTFYTVTEHALVFGPLFRKNSVQDQNLTRRIEEVIAYATFRKSHNTIISENTEAPIPHSLQVISLHMYPYYMVMDAALPGSKVPEDTELLELSGNRMIRFSLIPDTGPVIRRWIAPIKDSAPAPGEEELKHVIRMELEAFLSGIQKKSVDPVHEETRLKIFETIMTKGEESFKHLKDEKKYINLILRLLALDQSHGHSHGFDFGEMFPDYEPKTTPDEILDYRPALWEIFEGLPAASLDNLKPLVSLHTDYLKKAKNNPGSWREGNMILGAPGQEYIPSDEELILCEIDKRITIIVSGTELKTLQKYYTEHNLTGTELTIMTVEIWHADVMGSGRFFYASKPETEVLLRLE